jgi:hypothetical protein
MIEHSLWHNVNRPCRLLTCLRSSRHGCVKKWRDDREQQVDAVHQRHVRGAGEDSQLRGWHAGRKVAEDTTAKEAEHLDRVLRADEI